LRTEIIARYARFVWEMVVARELHLITRGLDPAGEWQAFGIETFQGHAGFLDGFAEGLEALGPLDDVIAEEWIERDRERALLVLRVRGGSTRTGVALTELADEFAFSIRMRDGTVLSAGLHASKAEALAAVDVRH
jgi:hypothetical protein